jgi:hypothetical protein
VYRGTNAGVQCFARVRGEWSNPGEAKNETVWTEVCSMRRDRRLIDPVIMRQLIVMRGDKHVAETLTTEEAQVSNSEDTGSDLQVISTVNRKSHKSSQVGA